MQLKEIKFAFLGSSRLSVIVLDELFSKGLVPRFIITTPDKPVGRKMIMTPNVVKTWAKEKNIPCYDPIKLDETFIQNIKDISQKEQCQFFLIASYGKIIPKNLIEIPPHKTLNIHPSLLPKYRGPSPLPTAILDDVKDTGISIMVLDQEMDHGPVISQENIKMEEWPSYEDFEEMMAKKGADLFASIIIDWINGKIIPSEQDHTKASYTKKISKEDGQISLDGPAYENFRKIQAYQTWPKAFFNINHHGKEIKVKITQAKFEKGNLQILKVIPEGGREMSFEDFKRGYFVP